MHFNPESRVSSLLKRAVLLLAVLVVLEASVFNLSFWTTLLGGGSPETLYTGSCPLKEDETFEVQLDAPAQISTLGIQVSSPCDLLIEVTDEGFSAGYVIERRFDPSVPKSEVFALHAYGKVKSLTITPVKVYAPDPIQDFVTRFYGPSISGVSIESVTTNEPIPFMFSVPRVAGLFALVAIIWYFGAARRKYREIYASERHGKILVASTAVLCAVFVAFSLPHAMLFGTLQTGADGSLDYRYPRIYENQYSELAKSFTEGRLYLQEEPPDVLLEAENPYDPAAEGHVHKNADTALFNGKYYVYFGVVPMLLFYLPFYLATGTGFPTFIGCLLCLLAVIIGATVLLRQLQRRLFPRATLGTLLLAQACVMFGSMIVWISIYPAIYHMPTSLGLACLVWGFVCFMALGRPGSGEGEAEAEAARPGRVRPVLLTAAGAFLFALILGCRPQLLIFALFAVPLWARQLKACSTAGGRAAYAAAAILPVVCVFAFIGWYNFARFGSPLDFGANYNLTTNDMRLRPLAWESGLLSFFYQFLQLPVLQMDFPFFGEAAFNAEFYEGVLVHEVMYGGIMWLAPFAWFAVSLLFSKRKALMRLAAAVLTACVVVAVFDGLAAGMLARYQLDFGLPLMMVAALGFMSWMQQSADGQTGSANLARSGASADFASVAGPDSLASPVNVWAVRAGTACLVISIIACVALCYQDCFYTQIGYTYLQYAFTL